MSSVADYAPLSSRAIDEILHHDFVAGYGPAGQVANRNRFYLYLTESGCDVQVRTVAVKASARMEQPIAKEVTLASVDDPWIHVRDLGFVGIAGYVVDWYRDGFGPKRYWDYEGRWEDETYGLRGMWKIHAPVVNPELLERTSLFQWAAWKPERGHILDYLKIYREHPEIEFLAKNGLGRFCTKISVIRKMTADRNFRQFFGRNADEIRDDGRIDVPVILKAYRKGISFDDARTEIEARRLFRGLNLPRCVAALKAAQYINACGVRESRYTDYLHNCEALGMDLADTKVSFPAVFEDRRQLVQDRMDAIRRKENAAKLTQLNAKLAGIAKEWSWLEQPSGAYRVVIPRTESEFSAEGTAMSNCLGQSQYAAKVGRGDCLVIFVRKSVRLAAAFVAVEYNLKSGKVSQCYGLQNSRPPEEVLAFITKLFSGVASAQLREAA